MIIRAFPKNRGYPKMDGENHGGAYFLMDDLGGKPTILGTPPYFWFLFEKNGKTSPPKQGTRAANEGGSDPATGGNFLG